MNQEHYMRLALAEAEKAAAAGEIPVGAVVVCGDTVLAAAHNDREATHSPLGHAEVRAIEQACRARGDWRLEDCTLYVTLEPCCHWGRTPPCTEAILEHNIGRVVVACLDPNPLVAGKGLQILREAGIACVSGVLEEECSTMLSQFFRELRKRKKDCHKDFHDT